MARIWNLKTCLFCIIGVVVGLTLLLITRFQASSGTVTHFDGSAHRLVKTGNDEDISAYYNPAGRAYPNEGENHQHQNKGPIRTGDAADYPFEEDFENQDNEIMKDFVPDPDNTNSLKGVQKQVQELNNKEDEGEPEEGGGAGGGEYQVNNNKAEEPVVEILAARYNGLRRKTPAASSIKCDVNNGKFLLDCKKEDNEVYIPFSFLHKYFEVYGKVSDKGDKFIWLHSNPKIYKPKSPYNPKGVFAYFENYNVEPRERVKCISGSYGVPISTQWDRNGYFYPIQVAQFGLSHYSKYIVEGDPERVILDDGEKSRGKWTVQSKSDLMVIQEPLHDSNHIIKVQHASVNHPVTVEVAPKKSRLLVLSWDMKTDTSLTLNDDVETNHNFNATLTAAVRYENQQYFLHYVTADFLIYAKENHIYHGLGKASFSRWQHIIRDLGVDVQKGVSSLRRKSGSKIVKSKITLESISISLDAAANELSSPVRLYLDNITLSSNEHLAQFYQTADWFVQTQDERGGWPIPVRRKFASDFYPVLESGWYSGMGQGHGLSVLARAYAMTRNPKYSRACANALKQIFDLPGSENGVRALFMDKYVWYEEYPTTPSTFVLNGFMYALLGLYDVKALNIPDAAEKAAKLYDEGLSSLKTMLPLYDTGSGTMYDLRHFTVPGITPNPARLDYHVTHINQLLTFATFESDPIFATTADRWIKYTQGDRAPHN